MDFTNSDYGSELSGGSSIINAAQINVYDHHKKKLQTGKPPKPDSSIKSVL